MPHHYLTIWRNEMKSTNRNPLACDLWNERQAHISMQQDAEKNKQDDLRAMNKKTIDDEAKRKQSVNQQFWHSMKEVIFMIVCAAIAVYTLIHFA